MTNRIDLEPAFVLHRRPFSNSSLIVDLFTKHHGRLSALARSARGMKSRYRSRLELFSPILVSWSGRNELKTLGNVEFSASTIMLQDNALLSGFYLNELLVRLLHCHDPHPTLFDLYQHTLQQLLDPATLQITLRCFEKNLLQQLGYGLSLTTELHSGKTICSDQHYRCVTDSGFIACAPDPIEASVFSGESLLALHHETFNNKHVLADAKRLMRLVLNHRLGNRPLKSRELLI